MKLTDVPTHMVTGGLAAAKNTNATPDHIRAIIAAAFTADENEPRPCPTIAAIDQSDLPAVREFAANHDPRQEST